MMENFILHEYDKLPGNLILAKSEQFFEIINKRRTIREYSQEQIPEEAIINIIKSAATSPSGANKQPWKFYLIKDKVVKRRIREEAEKVESLNYIKRFSESMKEDLKKFRTNYSKPFLEESPYLIVMFKEKYQKINGETVKNYYVNESCGIALGILISAIHFSGLSTVTYTANPMNFLNQILSVPNNYSPYVILPVGYPKDGTMLPVITRKSLTDILIKI